MLVSVIMPMRNAAQFVMAAASSVLQEKTVPLELLVVDDGSSDESAAIVRSIGDARIRIVPGPQQGIAACMNTGLSHARGDVIMRCDADDVYPTGRIASQMRLLNEYPQWIAVSGAFDMIDETGRIVASPFKHKPFLQKDDISNELCTGEMRTHLCTFAIRKQALSSIEWFRPFFQTAEDIDFAFRLAATGTIGFVSDCFYLYRIHGNSITHTEPSPKRVFFDEMAKRFALERMTRGSDSLENGNPPTPPLTTTAPPHDANQHLLGLLEGEAWRQFRQGQVLSAFKQGFYALRRFPMSPKTWHLLFSLAVKGLAKPFTPSINP